jgi:hypothetical protein
MRERITVPPAPIPLTEAQNLMTAATVIDPVRVPPILCVAWNQLQCLFAAILRPRVKRWQQCGHFPGWWRTGRKKLYAFPASRGGTSAVKKNFIVV